MSFEKKELSEAEKKIGYHFNNPELLVQAFTRTSYAKENEKESNEVLEFFGDKILSRYIVKRIAETFGCKDESKDSEFTIQSHEQEGDFTILLNSLVSNKHLASRTDILGLRKYRLLGKGENLPQNEEKPKADLLEAIMGAVAIDSNWNDTVIEIVRNKLLDIDSYIENWNFSSRKEASEYLPVQKEQNTGTVNSKLEIQFTEKNASAVLNELRSKHLCPRFHFSFTGVENKKDFTWSCQYQMEKGGYSGSTTPQKNKRTAKRIAAFEILNYLTEADNR